jgi:CRISPR-associated endonuclease/helicase Cas3
MDRAQNKAERLIQIENLLLAHPEGLTQAEIARRLKVDRSTINRYIPVLPKHIYIEDDGRWRLDRTADLINVRLNLHEALAVHLATRLLATRMDRQNPHAASALRKLGVAMQRWAARISHHVLESADVMDEAAQRNDPVYLQSLERLTLAWAEQRKVTIWHRSETTGKVHDYKFSPYFIEPYAVGQTTHVIGFSEPPGKMRTYKIERIERVDTNREAYEIPEDFDPRALLADAWGIWYTDGEPVDVTLKFHPRVAQRVRETRWHRSEQETELEDGSLLWTAKVAEPLEMLPWIRGWGPDGLRKALEKEVKRMAMVYGVDVIKPRDDLIAHRRERDGEEQLLVTHLVEASKLAGDFAAKVGLPEIGRIMGLLHDFGKASKEYQDYLRSAEGLINPDEDDYVDYKSKKGKIDHSTAGAQLIYQKLVNRGREGKFLGQFLALAIASHHSGLIDCLKPDGSNEFQRRIEKPNEDTHLTEALQKLQQIERQLDEILAQPLEKQFFDKIMSMKDSEKDATLPFKHGLLARLLLSCVLEADRLNTADFENPGNESIRNYGKYISWGVLIERLEAKFAEFARITDEMETESRTKEVNELRAQVAQACLDVAGKPKGIYQLTVPTGGGKTLASLRFALHHARAHGMDRVFYIVPYTTIIDQNADKVREILEKDGERDKVVLEHHSSLTPDKETRRHNLLAENWDAPIVFTTQVQFLEALFGSGTRDARRMHQLANSVIILDEVQTIPVRITQMFTTAARFLTHDCGATVVLCTATQPPFDKLENTYRKLNISPEQHIIPNEPELFQRLKRVEVYDERKPGGLTNTEIADLAEKALDDKRSVLVVVNTRASAQSLYQEIKYRQLGATTYHLSTNMCAAHRKDRLDEIRAKLEAKEPVVCISTQLIEAGVDIDFGAVIRALAGLDSIAQSAGRCNRHGMREDGGSVWVVNPQEESLDRLEDIRIGSEQAQRVLDDFRVTPNEFGEDRIGLKAIGDYYDFYYQTRKDHMAYPVSKNSAIGKDDNLFNLLSLNNDAVASYQRDHKTPPDILLRQSFKSAAGEFRVIDTLTRGVIIPYKEGIEVINDLCGAFAMEKQGKLLKRAQRYSVNLFDHQLKKLLQTGAIQEVQEGAEIYYLNEQYYSDEFGWSDKPVSDTTLHIE